jgi:aspartate kinase
MQHSAVSLSFCADTDWHKLSKLFETLMDGYSVKFNEGLVLLTIRHFREEDVQQLTKGREILLEQRSRINFQAVMRALPERW